VLTSDNPRGEDPLSIMNGVEAGIGPYENLMRVGDRASAIRLAVAQAGPDDVVVIAGKGHEREQLVGEARLPFSDEAIALERDIHARGMGHK
jgi:UDP-N-acetylmuramoyl-L-alanyl-D-glutamate--2,6-diaminopimelate ligase